MHVAIFHPGRLPVRTYGGTERVVVWLARGLTELGLEVTVVSARGSRIPGVGLIEIDRRSGNRHDFDLTPFLPPTADLAHYFVPIHRPPPIPHLWTMQGNARPGFDPGPNCVFVSRNHAERHSSRVFVYNGIDLAEYDPETPRGEYLLFLGRLHSVKGWREAIRVARRAGRSIVVAGGRRLMPRRGVRFVGRVGGVRKRELLAGARALLFPIEWDEPFGLVVPEAWASGTPVIAKPRGSLPELMTSGVGGLGSSTEELADLVGRCDGWSPQACRARAEQFSHLAMARNYLAQYQHLLAHGTLEPGQTST